MIRYMHYVSPSRDLRVLEAKIALRNYKLSTIAEYQTKFRK